jgi:hypothetical protein
MRIISARKAEPYKRRKYHDENRKHDWSRFYALTDEEVHAAALCDPDAQPLTGDGSRA